MDIPTFNIFRTFLLNKHTNSCLSQWFWVKKGLLHAHEIITCDEWGDVKELLRTSLEHLFHIISTKTRPPSLSSGCFRFFPLSALECLIIYEYTIFFCCEWEWKNFLCRQTHCTAAYKACWRFGRIKEKNTRRWMRDSLDHCLRYSSNFPLNILPPPPVTCAAMWRLMKSRRRLLLTLHKNYAMSLSMCILSHQWWDFLWSLQAGAYLSPIIFPLINFFVNSRRLVIIVGGDDEVCARQWESLWYEKRKWNKIIIICCSPARLFSSVKFCFEGQTSCS